MILGIVNSEREATVRIIIRSLHGSEQEFEAVIDTGFTGYLTLPSALIASLGLGWRGREQAILGDGRLQTFDVYAATVLWDGQSRTVEVDAAETEPLIGMSLLYGHEVTIQAVDGGAVTIKQLP